MYLSVNNNLKGFYVHRLLAQLFIPNPHNKPCVNHIDGNKTNFNLSNLQWCTYKENNNHAFDTGLQKKGKDHHYYGKTGENRANYKFYQNKKNNLNKK